MGSSCLRLTGDQHHDRTQDPDLGESLDGDASVLSDCRLGLYDGDAFRA